MVCTFAFRLLRRAARLKRQKLLAHKDAFFASGRGWRGLFALYNLTSTPGRRDRLCFEIDAAALPEGDEGLHSYSRDRRSDCP